MGSIVGVAAGGAELVHPPARTNPIPHTIRIRRGNLIQEKCYFDMINVPQKAGDKRCELSTGVSLLTLQNPKKIRYAPEKEYNP
jgi:hypothetical protein